MQRFFFSLGQSVPAPVRRDRPWYLSGLAAIALTVSVTAAFAGTAQAEPSPTPSASPASKPVVKPAVAKPAVVALARHLRSIGAKMYGAYWCPHCHHQRELIGEATFKTYIPYVECAADGVNAQPALCRAKKIEGYPTWEIKGKFYSGTQSLEELANLSGYRGARGF